MPGTVLSLLHILIIKTLDSSGFNFGSSSYQLLTLGKLLNFKPWFPHLEHRSSVPTSQVVVWIEIIQMYLCLACGEGFKISLLLKNTVLVDSIWVNFQLPDNFPSKTIVFFLSIGSQLYDSAVYTHFIENHPYYKIIALYSGYNYLLPFTISQLLFGSKPSTSGKKQNRFKESRKISKVFMFQNQWQDTWSLLGYIHSRSAVIYQLFGTQNVFSCVKYPLQ